MIRPWSCPTNPPGKQNSLATTWWWCREPNGRYPMAVQRRVTFASIVLAISLAACTVSVEPHRQSGGGVCRVGLRAMPRQRDRARLREGRAVRTKQVYGHIPPCRRPTGPGSARWVKDPSLKRQPEVAHRWGHTATRRSTCDVPWKYQGRLWSTLNCHPWAGLAHRLTNFKVLKPSTLLDIFRESVSGPEQQRTPSQRFQSVNTFACRTE